MNRIDFPINGINGRYFVDGDTGEVYSLVNCQQPGIPYKLKPTPAGGYGLLRKGDWYTTSITQKYINTLIAQHNQNKKEYPAAINIPKVIDNNKYVIAICNDLYGETYTYDQLQARVEELVSEGDCEPEDIQVLVDPGFTIKVKTTVSFVKE